MSPAAVDAAQLRAALEDIGDHHGPGLLGLVVEDGSVVFDHAVGVAELGSDRPMTADHQVRIGSITKTYVAALVLQLASQALFTIDDTLQQWLPDLVPGGDEITLEMLLRMRSGLPDYLETLLGDPPDLRALAPYRAPEDLVALAMSAPGRTAPDAGYRYCNLDYVLLGLVVEQVTGQRVEAQLWQRLFMPLGLADTTFPTVDPHIRGRHAHGHLRSDPAAPYLEFTTMSPSPSFTAGGIVATPREVATFFDALVGGRVLDPQSLAAMTACPEILGERTGRGLGIIRYSSPGGAVAFGAHGGIPGYTTMVLSTTEGRTIVLSQNGFDGHDPLALDNPFCAAACR